MNNPFNKLTTEQGKQLCKRVTEVILQTALIRRKPIARCIIDEVNKMITNEFVQQEEAVRTTKKDEETSCQNPGTASL